MKTLQITNHSNDKNTSLYIDKQDISNLLDKLFILFNIDPETIELGYYRFQVNETRLVIVFTETNYILVTMFANSHSHIRLNESIDKSTTCHYQGHSRDPKTRLNIPLKSNYKEPKQHFVNRKFKGRKDYIKPTYTKVDCTGITGPIDSEGLSTVTSICIPVLHITDLQYITKRIKTIPPNTLIAFQLRSYEDGTFDKLRNIHVKETI